MNTKARIDRLEASTRAAAGGCTVTYKALHKVAPPETMSLDAAVQLARKGVVRSISFPMSFNETEAERRHGLNELDRAFSELKGISRDGSPMGMDSRLLLTALPVLYAKQAPPHAVSNGHLCGGYFVTDDGEEFHQTQWQEILKRRGCGFIVVTDYDETREPWAKRPNE